MTKEGLGVRDAEMPRAPRTARRRSRRRKNLVTRDYYVDIYHWSPVVLQQRGDMQRHSEAGYSIKTCMRTIDADEGNTSGAGR